MVVEEPCRVAAWPCRSLASGSTTRRGARCRRKFCAGPEEGNALLGEASNDYKTKG